MKSSKNGAHISIRQSFIFDIEDNMKKQKNAPQILLREEWPYEVPENWVWSCVGSLCSFVGGGTPSKDTPEYWNGNIPWASIKDMKGDYLSDTVDHITEIGYENSATNLCDEGDLLLATRIEPGKTIISKKRMAVNQDLKIVKSNISSVFLHYYFKTFQHELEHKSSGSTVKGITIPNVQSTPFPLPPLPEQQRIVDRIESLFAKLDAAAEKIRATLDAFPTRKAALLHKAFTGEMTKKWREDHGVGMESWEKTLLKEQTSSIGDGLHGTPIYDEAGEYYFVNGNNLNTTHIEIKNDTKRVNEKEYNKYRVQLSSNTILLSINGTLGNTAFYQDEPIILGKSACYINILPTISKYFLRYYFCSWEFRDYANAKSTGSTIKNLGLKAIRELPIFLPTLPEQQEIVRRLDAILAREQTAKETAERLLETISLTKKSILAKAFRGLLGTNNPKEESAEGLLREQT